MTKLTRERVIAKIASRKTLQGECFSNINLTDANLRGADLCIATYNRKQLEDATNVDKAKL